MSPRKTTIHLVTRETLSKKRPLPTECGKKTGPLAVTTDAEAVTCLECLRAAIVKVAKQLAETEADQDAAVFAADDIDDFQNDLDF